MVEQRPPKPKVEGSIPFMDAFYYILYFCMDYDQREHERKKLKKKIDHILEPLLIDLLIKKPEDSLEFMIEWLDKRKKFLSEVNRQTDS